VRSGPVRTGRAPASSRGSDDHSPLKVKEGGWKQHRYIVCLNDDEERKDDAAARRSWRAAEGGEQLRKTGQRRWWATKGTAATSAAKTTPSLPRLTEGEGRRRTHAMTAWDAPPPTELESADAALPYKRLWTVVSETLVTVVQSTVADAHRFYTR